MKMEKKQKNNQGKCLETSRGKTTLLMIHLKRLNSLAAVCFFFCAGQSHNMIYRLHCEGMKTKQNNMDDGLKDENCLRRMSLTNRNEVSLLCFFFSFPESM